MLNFFGEKQKSASKKAHPVGKINYKKSAHANCDRCGVNLGRDEIFYVNDAQIHQDYFMKLQPVVGWSVEKVVGEDPGIRRGCLSRLNNRP